MDKEEYLKELIALMDAEVYITDHNALREHWSELKGFLTGLLLPGAIHQEIHIQALDVSVPETGPRPESAENQEHHGVT